MDCSKSPNIFCCTRSRGSHLVLIHMFGAHFLQRETGSQLISPENKGLIVGRTLFEELDRNSVSANYQILK